MLKITDSTLVEKSMAAGSVANGSEHNGLSIDLLGWDYAHFIVTPGTDVAGSLKLQVSTDNTTWLDIKDGSIPFGTVDQPVVIETGRLDRRYARVVAVADAPGTVSVESGIVLLCGSIDKPLPPANANVLGLYNKPATV